MSFKHVLQNKVQIYYDDENGYYDDNFDDNLNKRFGLSICGEKSIKT